MLRVPALTSSGILAGFQVVVLILFATLADYAPYEDPALNTNVTSQRSNSISDYYPMFQDIHVMIFFGIGFLLTFMKKYGYASISYNLFIGALIVQWSTLVNCWVRNAFDGVLSALVLIDIKTLITSDFAAATVLISFCVVLGKVSRFQIFLIGIFEVIFYALNENIVYHKLYITDVGGSIPIHVFAAYFGLAVARVMHSEDIAEENPKEGSTYNSDLFSTIGTIFLWIYWPSFNSVILGPGTQQNRAIINTYFSMAAGVMATFVISPLLSKKHKMSMVHVQNATLAGGVAVGTMANLVIQPWGAILVGMVAATICSLGFTYGTSFLKKRLKVHDTCGVHNLHALPGIVAAIGGAIAAAMAKEEAYGKDFYAIWPARQTIAATNTTVEHLGRTGGAQAGFQIMALIVTIAIAIIGGFITGFIVKFIDQPTKKELYDDAPFFEMPDEYSMSKKTDEKMALAEQQV